MAKVSWSVAVSASVVVALLAVRIMADDAGEPTGPIHRRGG
jgi:hypothetical protein